MGISRCQTLYFLRINLSLFMQILFQKEYERKSMSGNTDFLTFYAVKPHTDLIQLWGLGLTLNDLILAKCVTALVLFKCRVFLSVNISKVLAALDKQMTFYSSSFPSLKQRSWILMSVENYVVMHVSLENINSSHKKVKGSKKVFTVNWKQSVNGVLI